MHDPVSDQLLDMSDLYERLDHAQAEVAHWREMIVRRWQQQIHETERLLTTPEAILRHVEGNIKRSITQVLHDCKRQGWNHEDAKGAATKRAKEVARRYGLSRLTACLRKYLDISATRIFGDGPQDRPRKSRKPRPRKRRSRSTSKTNRSDANMLTTYENEPIDSLDAVALQGRVVADPETHDRVSSTRRSSVGQ